MSAESSHVIIVGAGPAGAVLANFLATRGIRVTLLERQSDFAREFRGEAIAPAGRAVLRALDMDDVLDRVPHADPSVFELFVKRERLLHLTAQDLGADVELPRVYSQPALLEAIVGETTKRTNLVFERGASVKELLRENGRVVGVRVRNAEGERRLFADLVIGCDGRASVVRRQAPLEVASEDLPMDVAWFKIAAPEDWKGECRLRACVGNGHLLIGYITYDGMLQLAWVIPKGSFGEMRSRGMEALVGDMADHAPADLADHLRRHAQELARPFLLSTAADCVRNWSVPGALVIGDAAHTMSPVGGQGINIALRDAVVAANHLVPALQAGADPVAIDAAAAWIGGERMSEITQVQTLQARRRNRANDPRRTSAGNTEDQDFFSTFLRQREDGRRDRVPHRASDLAAGLIPRRKRPLDFQREAVTTLANLDARLSRAGCSLATFGHLGTASLKVW